MATITLDGNLSVYDFVGTSGSLDINGQNVYSQNFTVTSPFTIVPGDIDVTGTFSSNGVDWLGTSAWELTVDGLGSFIDGDIAYCDASNGETINGMWATDSGNNFNVLFRTGDDVVTPEVTWTFDTIDRDYSFDSYVYMWTFN